jgi:catechol 2,3-dioxygenase-like lactoylglutathione lyase family enzyme
MVLLILHCSDLEASTAFYRDLIGVPLERDRNDPEVDPWIGGLHDEYSWREGAYLHFALYPARPPLRPVTSGAQVGFVVDEVLDHHERLYAAGVEVLHGPRPEPWGRTARYLDPDGNVVNLTTR